VEFDIIPVTGLIDTLIIAPYVYGKPAKYICIL